MKAKTIALVGILIAFAAAAAMFIADGDPPTLVGTAIGYTGVLGAWLGFDLAKTRDRTLGKPPGKYEDLRLGRYIFATLSLVALLVVTFVTDSDGSLSGVRAALVPCIYSTIAIVVAAYGANKVATPKGDLRNIK